MDDLDAALASKCAAADACVYDDKCPFACRRWAPGDQADLDLCAERDAAAVRIARWHAVRQT